MTIEQLADFLRMPQEEFEPVRKMADRVRKEQKGDEVFIRGIIEFSNYCRRRCRYCGLNCENTSCVRYRMAEEDVVETAQEGFRAGYRTVVLQSGEDPYFTKEILGQIVKEIKRTTNLAVTLSCGELSDEEYAYLKQCGTDRYLLKHETADRALYDRMHPCGTLENRVHCLKTLKKLGYETGGGFMVGLPGQTEEILAKDLRLLAEIPCDMAGIGPFLPHPKTPLAREMAGSAELVERCVALARLMLPAINLPATTALEVLLKGSQERIFRCGANVIMRKLTPKNVRKYYEIYPADLEQMKDIKTERKELEQFIKHLGRTPN